MEDTKKFKVQLIGFLSTEPLCINKMKEEIKKKTKNLTILLLVDNVSDVIENKISELRVNTSGMMRRVCNEE